MTRRYHHAAAWRARKPGARPARPGRVTKATPPDVPETPPSVPETPPPDAGRSDAELEALVAECLADGLTFAPCIARFAGCDEKTARRIIRRLRDRGKKAAKKEREPNWTEGLSSPGDGPNAHGAYICRDCGGTFRATAAGEFHRPAGAPRVRPFARVGGRAVCGSCAKERFQRRPNPQATYGNR